MKTVEKPIHKILNFSCLNSVSFAWWTLKAKRTPLRSFCRILICRLLFCKSLVFISKKILSELAKWSKVQRFCIKLGVFSQRSGFIFGIVSIFNIWDCLEVFDWKIFIRTLQNKSVISEWETEFNLLGFNNYNSFNFSPFTTLLSIFLNSLILFLLASFDATAMKTEEAKRVKEVRGMLLARRIWMSLEWEAQMKLLPFASVFLDG